MTNLRAWLLVTIVVSALPAGLRAEPVPARARTPEAREQALQTVLSRNEFSGSADTFLSSTERRAGRAWSRGWRAFGRWIGRGTGGILDASAPLATVLSVVLIVLFLLLLAWVISRIGGARLAETAVEADSPYAGPNSPQLALDQAARAAASGDFRTALRLVYLAALLKLDERDLIRFDRTGTNWEYLAALKKEPELQRALRPATMTFDRTWYGHQTATETDYQSFLGAYGAVESSGGSE